MKEMFIKAGERIRFVREFRGLERKLLCDIVGITEEELTGIEERGNGFSGEVLYNVSRALNVEPNYLFSGTLTRLNDEELEAAIKLNSIN